MAHPYIVIGVAGRRDAARRLSGAAMPACAKTRADYARANRSRVSRQRTRKASSTAISSRRTSSSQQDGRVKILDFGLAKLMNASGRVGSGTTAMSIRIRCRAWCWARSVICRRNRCAASPSIIGRTSSPSARSCTRCWLDAVHSGRHSRGYDDRDPEGGSAGSSDRRSAHPPALARIVDRCLDKNPAARFQSAGDMAFALEALSAHSGATEALTESPVVPAKRLRLAWIVVGARRRKLCGAAVGSGLRALRASPADDPRTFRFSIAPPEGWTLAVGAIQPTGVAISPLAVSPNGWQVAIVAHDLLISC